MSQNFHLFHVSNSELYLLMYMGSLTPDALQGSSETFATSSSTCDRIITVLQLQLHVFIDKRGHFPAPGIDDTLLKAKRRYAHTRGVYSQHELV